MPAPDGARSLKEAFPMKYELSAINDAIRQDPAAFMQQCEADYDSRVEQAARQIAPGVRRSPIVLLAGPSGSGKTTTAGRLEKALEKLGVHAHLISLDDYFRDVNPATHPRTEDGDIDYESPLCLDTPLLNRHFTELEQGREILVPKFNFARSKREPDQVTPLRAAPGEAILFEGIHAFNSLITEQHPQATRVYISAQSPICRDGEVFFTGTWMRLMRRCVRDYNSRGTSVETTLQMWGNVLRGEDLYIAPFLHGNEISFDTTLAYEVPVLAVCARPLFEALPDTAPRLEEVRTVLDRAAEFLPLSPADVSPDSLLQEFISH